MSDQLLEPTPDKADNPGLIFIALGALFLGLSIVGIVLLQFIPVGSSQIANGAIASATQRKDTYTTTPTANRRTPVASVTAIAYQTPIRPSPIPFTPTPESTSTPSRTAQPPPEVIWTTEEFNALSWMCYGEVSGMRDVKIDACLSVISTVRQRYAYPNAFRVTTVLEALFAPNQFHVDIYTDSPSPDAVMNATVEDYQFGARGSCTGFLFFNSISGGPADCVIRSPATGLFMNFHNQSLR